jgi:hypothetical protein
MELDNKLLLFYLFNYFIKKILLSYNIVNCLGFKIYQLAIFSITDTNILIGNKYKFSFFDDAASVNCENNK